MRILTTTSPLVAAKGINSGGLRIRIRNTKTGRFVRWETAKLWDFGCNGRSPVTYNHVESRMTFRTLPRELSQALIHQKYGAKSVFIMGGGIIQDGQFNVAWRDDWKNKILGAYDTHLKSFWKYVFELYL